MDVIDDIFNTKRVLYQCSCLLRKPLTHIYLCRHCFKIRCKDCVSHEVDSQFCQHCLEYIPMIDAKLKRNKCVTCFQCPNCSQTLTSKTFLASIPSETDPNVMTTKKAQYLQCSYCKWSTKDVGIPDQFYGSGGWPEVKVPNQKRIEDLIDHYRSVAQRVRIEKEKKRINPRPGHAIHLLDKYGIAASLSPRIAESLRTKTYIGRLANSQIASSKSSEEIKIEPSVPVKPQPLDCEYHYKKELDETTISTLEQRLSLIEHQPTTIPEFYPLSKTLYVKRSLRCKECDHNLSKPEYSSSSIKFKITLSAFYDIPEVKISSVPELLPDKECIVELTLKNPCQYVVHASIIPITEEKPGIPITGQLKMSKSNLILECKDDTLEIDSDQVQKVRHNDDPKLIAFRRNNKVVVKIPVVPTAKSGDCWIWFKLKHEIMSSVFSLQSTGNQGPQVIFIEHIVYINLGPIGAKKEISDMLKKRG
ncbi:dynactin subunit 4 [Brevipalpus obovatus]|uniref:dynactin subunit 4 n=1 Tax=Brevipalpus obovatus TaxID=246614 RepID=UPI003D9EC2DA